MTTGGTETEARRAELVLHEIQTLPTLPGGDPMTVCARWLPTSSAAVVTASIAGPLASSATNRA